MHSYLLTLAYDGCEYAGWQRQDGFETIQSCVERAFGVLLGSTVPVHGAGRTDAGVHALRQTAHVRIEREFDCHELLCALNGNLPKDIAVRAVQPVSSEFHARFSAIGKRYLYRSRVSRIRPVHATGFYHWVRRPLDLAKMQHAAKNFVGEHDFAAFASNPGYERSHGTVRRIHHMHVIRRAWGFDLFAQGNGFLYNMVRTIAGTLIEVGLGKINPDEIRHILASRDRSQAGPNAPAQGLYLMRVLYPADSLRTYPADSLRTPS
ncbi:MAG: tRNA pseudouridine(38-40) synthase TruA [Planctomycetota bacterium]